MISLYYCPTPNCQKIAFRYPNEAPYPHLEARTDRVFERPAVQRGFRVDLDKVRPVVIGAEPVTDAVRTHLFASHQSGDGATRKKARSDLAGSIQKSNGRKTE